MDTTLGITESDDVAALGNEALLASLRRLLASERALSARLLIHLGEVDARGLYREQAFASMFEYCVRALHLSEAESYMRIRAARLGRQFPRVLRMMAAGELHLSAVTLLAPVLTEANSDDLLDQARCKSKREVELLLAQRFEKPDVSSSIRALPTERLFPERAGEDRPAPRPERSFAADASPESTTSSGARDGLAARSSPAPQPQPESQPRPQPRVSPPPALTPLGPKRYKVQLTANQSLHDKLRRAQDLMRHEVPDGDLAHVLDRALDLLIAERMKRRFGKTEKPRVRAGVSAKPGSRHVPHAVRREVLARDGARCTYQSPDGKRCEQRGRLELHHEQPFGRGGPATVENIRLLCSSHNQLLAERDYGRAFMRERIESTPRREGRQEPG